jgi:hypothetical protein
MPICAKCRQGFDVEQRNCPNCGTAAFSGYVNNYSQISNFWVGQGILLLVGLVSTIMLGSPDPFNLALSISYIWTIFWAYIDAETRGKPGCAVALLVILLSWIGLLIWVVFRP